MTWHCVTLLCYIWTISISTYGIVIVISARAYCDCRSVVELDTMW